MRMVVLGVLLGACSGDTDKTTPTADTGTNTPTDTGTPLPRPDAILALTGDPVAGEALYLSNCQGCHGVDGLGTLSGPSLVDRLTKIDELAIVTVLLEGSGNMSDFAILEDQELADISAYIQQAFGS